MNMRNSKITLIICLVLVFHTTQVKAQSIWDNKEFGNSFGLAPSVILFPYGENLLSSFGLQVDIPILVRRTYLPLRETYLRLDLGWYFAGKNLRNNFDTFSYIDSEEWNGKRYVTFYDGTINRECHFVPVSLNYDIFFRFANDNLFFHFGPSIGETTLIAYNKYYDNDGDDKDYYDEFPKEIRSKAVFNYGANIGLKYDVTCCRDFVVGVRYQFMFNHKTSFENEIIQGGMNQISFVLSGGF